MDKDEAINIKQPMSISSSAVKKNTHETIQWNRSKEKLVKKERQKRKASIDKDEAINTEQLASASSSTKRTNVKQRMQHNERNQHETKKKHKTNASE